MLGGKTDRIAQKAVSLNLESTLVKLMYPIVNSMMEKMASIIIEKIKKFFMEYSFSQKLFVSFSWQEVFFSIFTF